MVTVSRLLSDTSTEEQLLIAGNQSLIDQQDDHGVGSTTEIVGPETLPVGGDTLVLENLHEAIPQVLVGHFTRDGISLHVHQSVLHKIEGKGSESTAESRHSGRKQVRAETLAEGLIEELLSLIVRSHHSKVHGHSTEDHRKTTSPQSPKTLLLRDTDQGSEAVAVSTALVNGKQTIGLHAHHSDIEGVSNHSSQSTRGQGRHCRGEEGNGSTIALLQIVREHTVQTQTGSSINGLSHKGGGKTSIKLHHSLLLNELLRDGDSSHIGRLSNKLDTSLNQIDRLDLYIREPSSNLQ